MDLDNNIEEQTHEEDLDTLLGSAVTNLARYIVSPNIRWQRLGNDKTQICKDDTIKNFTLCLYPFVSFIFRFQQFSIY